MAKTSRAKVRRQRSNKSGETKEVQSLHTAEVQTLHSSEQIVRRFVLNQPSSRYGMKPGWFRDTVSCEEFESLRVHFVLWTRGRVYFEGLADSMPRCKSMDGLRPAPEVVEPISEECGAWDERGLFVPKCPLAMWNTGEKERRAPVCKESWNLLGIAQDDGLPFWLSAKGSGLRPTRQFLSMCYARIRMQGAKLFQCAITLTSTLVENQFGQFYVLQFRQPEWLTPDDRKYAQLEDVATVLSEERIERTYEHELQQLADGPATA